MSELNSEAELFAAHLEAHDVFKMPIFTQTSAASAMNAAMIGLLQQVHALGVPFSDHATAVKLLVEKTIAEVVKCIPTSWDSVADFVGKLIKDGKTDLAKGTPFESLIKKKANKAVISAIRTGMACHIVTSLGMQTYMQQEGPMVVPKPYLSPLMATLFSALGKACDLTQVSELQLPNIFERLQEPYGSSRLRLCHQLYIYIYICVYLYICVSSNSESLKSSPRSPRAGRRHQIRSP